MRVRLTVMVDRVSHTSPGAHPSRGLRVCGYAGLFPVERSVSWPSTSTGPPPVGAIGYFLGPPMQVGVPTETAEGERRVALVPEVVAKLKARGLDILVQRGAGSGALLPDAAFADAGARLTDDAAEVYRSDIVVKIS